MLNEDFSLLHLVRQGMKQEARMRLPNLKPEKVTHKMRNRKNPQARTQQSNVPVILFFENFTQRDASALRHQQSHTSSTVSHEMKALPDALRSREAEARAAPLAVRRGTSTPARCLGAHASGSSTMVSRSVMPLLCGEAAGQNWAIITLARKKTTGK